MNLARDKFRRLIGEADRFAEAGVRVKVLGNVSLLPQDLRDLIGLAANKIFTLLAFYRLTFVAG